MDQEFNIVGNQFTKMKFSQFYTKLVLLELDLRV